MEECNTLNTNELANDVQSVIKTLSELAQKRSFVFRGYSNQSQLLPGIIRNNDLSDLESSLLLDFEKYACYYFNANTPIDFLSCAQHFGLPTRLLDFTHNPFIALFFALGEPKDPSLNGEDRDYYYIQYTSLKNNLCVRSIPLNDDVYNMEFARTDSMAKKCMHYFDSVKDLFGKNIVRRTIRSLNEFIDYTEDPNYEAQKLKDHTLLFVDPPQSNQRIIMQQGLFMLPYTLNKEEHLQILNKHSQVLKIHKDLRKELILHLDTLGYNTFRLMPDLSSICNAIKRKHINTQ